MRTCGLKTIQECLRFRYQSRECQVEIDDAELKVKLMIRSLPASAFSTDPTETERGLTSSVGEPVVPVNTTHTEPAAPPSVIPTEVESTSTSPAERKIYEQYTIRYVHIYASRLSHISNYDLCRTHHHYQ